MKDNIYQKDLISKLCDDNVFTSHPKWTQDLEIFFLFFFYPIYWLILHHLNGALFPHTFESKCWRDRDERNNQCMTLCSLQYISGSQYISCAVPCTPFHHNFILWQKKVGRRCSCLKSVLDDDGKCLIVRRSVRLKLIPSFTCTYLKCPTWVYTCYSSIYCITCEMERKTFLDPDKNRNVEVSTTSLIILNTTTSRKCSL